jgi:hypothetical protein
MIEKKLDALLAQLSATRLPCFCSYQILFKNGGPKENIY